MTRRPNLPILIAAGAALAAGAFAAALMRDPAPSLKTATVLQTPRAIAEVRLLDENGATVGNEALRGQWHLLFAGFTSCPHICPTTLATLNRIVGTVGAGAPRVLLLSVDPQRDTPARMKAYLAGFNPGFGGLTGDAQQLQRLRDSLGLVAAPVTENGGYTVDHSSSLVLLDPQARIVAYLSPPFDETAIADDLRALVKKKA